MMEGESRGSVRRPIPSVPMLLAIWREAEAEVGKVSDPLARDPEVERVYLRKIAERAGPVALSPFVKPGFVARRVG